jgi:O-antigen/teichoic acid export membrane protein
MSERRYGAVLSYVSLGLNLAVAFLLTPILVHTLGKGQYGVFALISSITGYFLLMDMGLDDTVLRYVIRYRRSSEEGALATFLGTTVVGYMILVALLLIVGVVGYQYLDPAHWPKLTPRELDDLRFMYVIGLTSSCLVLVTNPFAAILAAYQRFVFIQSAAIATRLITAVLVVVYLQFGESVRIVFILNTVIQASVCLLQVFYVLFNMRLPLQFRRVPWSYVREKLNFAGPVFLTVMVTMIYWRLDNILVGSIVGSVSLAIYTVGLLFQKHMLKLSTSLTKVWNPQLLARLEAGASDDEATLLVAKVARLQLMIMLPVMAGIIALGRQFLTLWLGPDFQPAYWVMVIALTPYVLEQVGASRNVILQVRGLYWWRTGALIVFSVLNVAVTLYLLPRIGIVGGAIGTGGGLLLGYIYSHMLLQMKAGFSLRLFFGELLKGLWLVILALAAGGLALQYLRLDNWVSFFAAVAVYGGGYALLAWLIGMNRTERGYVLSFARDARLARS